MKADILSLALLTLIGSSVLASGPEDGPNTFDFSSIHSSRVEMTDTAALGVSLASAKRVSREFERVTSLADYLGNGKSPQLTKGELQEAHKVGLRVVARDGGLVIRLGKAEVSIRFIGATYDLSNPNLDVFHFEINGSRVSLSGQEAKTGIYPNLMQKVVQDFERQGQATKHAFLILLLGSNHANAGMWDKVKEGYKAVQRIAGKYVDGALEVGGAKLRNYVNGSKIGKYAEVACQKKAAIETAVVNFANSTDKTIDRAVQWAAKTIGVKDVEVNEDVKRAGEYAKDKVYTGASGSMAWGLKQVATKNPKVAAAIAVATIAYGRGQAFAKGFCDPQNARTAGSLAREVARDSLEKVVR